MAWLVALIGDAGRRKLTDIVLGTDQERALARAAEGAVRRTAAAFASEAGERRDHLALVIGEVFTVSSPGALGAYGSTLFAAIGSGITEQLVVLGDPNLC